MSLFDLPLFSLSAPDAKEEEITSFCEYLREAVLLVSMADEEKLAVTCATEETRKLVEKFLNGSLPFFLGNFSAEGDANFCSDLEKLSPGEVVLFVRPEQGLPRVADMNEAENLNSFHIIHLGEMGAQLDPVEIGRACLRNLLEPFVKSMSGDGQGKTGRALAELLQKKVAEIEFYLLQHSPAHEIPQVQLAVDKEMVALVALHGDVPAEQLPEELFRPELLNTLHDTVNKWYALGRLLVKNFKEVNFGSIAAEVNYWSNYHSALLGFKRQIEQPEVRLSIEILRYRRKFLKAGLAQELGLAEKITTVEFFAKTMRELPLTALGEAEDSKGLADALNRVFEVVKRLFGSPEYSMERSLCFLEALSNELMLRLLSLIEGQNVLTMESAAREEMLSAFKLHVINGWNTHISYIKDKVFKGGSTDRTRFATAAYRMKHSRLYDRLRTLSQCRDDYEGLRRIAAEITEKRDQPNESTILLPLLTVADVDRVWEQHFGTLEQLFGLEPADEDRIASAKKGYDAEIELYVKEIATRIRELLSAARNHAEMLAVFSRFSALIRVPQIRSAVREYQEALLAKIQDDTYELVARYKRRFETTGGAEFARMRGIPAGAGSYIWAEQLVQHMHDNLLQAEAILGDRLSQQNKGQEIQKFYDNFVNKRTKDNPLARFEQLAFEYSGKLLALEPMPRGSGYRLTVNFSPEAKRALEDFRVIIKQKDAFKAILSKKYNFRRNGWPVYVNVLKLMETVRLLNLLLPNLEPMLVKLLATQLHRVYAEIERGFTLQWGARDPLESDSQHYFQGFMEVVTALEEEGDFVLEKMRVINQEITAMADPGVDPTTLTAKLQAIQHVIDGLLLRELSNMDAVVEELNVKIEGAFLKKLTDIVTVWREEFIGFRSAAKVRDRNRFIKDATSHSIQVRGRAIYATPPVQRTRAYWLRHLHTQLSLITAQKRIRADVYLQDAGEGDTFSALLARLPAGLLASAYRTISESVQAAEEYVRTWLRYQALWEIDLAYLYRHLGTELGEWVTLLTEIRQGRNPFDNARVERNFGPVVIEYRVVQSKVMDVYDGLQERVFGEFGRNFISGMRALNEQVTAQRLRLDRLGMSSPTELMDALVTLSFVRENVGRWETQASGFAEHEKLLFAQKPQLPEDYKSAQALQKECQRLRQTYQAKAQLFEGNMGPIREVLAREEEVVGEKVREIEALWNTKKPFAAELRPRDALEVLSQLEAAIQANRDRVDKLNQTNALLKLPTIELDLINTITEESTQLREVWRLLDAAWGDLDAALDMSLLAANPVTVGQTLDALAAKLEDCPPLFREHEVVVGKRHEVARLRRKARVLRDIRSEAIKESHMTELLKRMQITRPIADVRVSDIFALDLEAMERQISDVVQLAQGELVLESMLVRVKDFWYAQEFQTWSYKGKCLLIKGWDELMNKAEEDLAQLTTMRLSQHFKSFEGEVNAWHERLSRVDAALGVWVEVQRKWIYLEGIFTGSADIRTQLTAEFDRFTGIDRDFISIMKRVEARPKVMDAVATIPELQKTLEYLADALAKVQKGLNEYLETQRQAFSRFYFVGDEDLLEIIGNAQDVRSVQKYFAKMFAGICAVEVGADQSLAAMQSREGEAVALERAVQVNASTRINEWLAELERQMRGSLQGQLEVALGAWRGLREGGLQALVEHRPTQSILLGFQLHWTLGVEELLLAKKEVGEVEKSIVRLLVVLAEDVLRPLPPLVRRRMEQLITELVHKRDVTRSLAGQSRLDLTDFRWRYHSRYYLMSDEPDRHRRVRVRIGNADFAYGHEYLGAAERLVQTPLTDKCFFTLTQALWLRMGGAPFGPAGTGKTESVKALGCNLGRFVLVFNCDENFNDAAMGRIFIGLCQVGAWGCFDEFNRLEEKILSAVSQQILAIQTGLREKSAQIDFKGRAVALNADMGVFVTMNPDYAGRSNLPENLKQLFRQMAMVRPDSALIAQVMLFSQGFKSAEELSGRVVALFDLCACQLSAQPHYDFGLRALKSVLNSAGALKRRVLGGEETAEPHAPAEEQRIVLRCFADTVMPKLVAEDEPLLRTLVRGMFPGTEVPPPNEPALIACLQAECEQRFLRGDNPRFIEKALQLHQILRLHHGVMLVGSTGSGKSAAWKTLFAALGRLERTKGEFYIIDPKAITKDELYGRLDANTMEWTDGVFTHILRRICENQRGEREKRQWIIFDGDVDPEWAENLNSVLDDNKLLTLPNGDRLAVPPNVRILFEVETLRYATLATVSRCGMVWFSREVIGLQDIYAHYLARLREESFDAPTRPDRSETGPASALRDQLASAITPLFAEGVQPALVTVALELAEEEPHVMECSRIRLLEAFFALVRKGVSRVVEHDELKFGNYSADAPLVTRFMLRWTVSAMAWAFSGDLTLAARARYFERLMAVAPPLPDGLAWPPTDSLTTLIDYEVRLEEAEFGLWRERVPQVDIPHERVTAADLIIPTVDTLRHQEVLCGWLLEHRPFIICGPPGSGKTMTLMSTLKGLQDFDMIFVNFSSSTTPALILKQFEHYCEYGKGAGGVVLRPRALNKWLVVFCDEINLPDEDKYGTQAVITFLRQLAEQHGFWRTADRQWVALERLQFVGACNPPTDAGRHPLAPRFLRHCPLLLVDFPSHDSLVQIYGTFNRAMMKRTPALMPYAEPLTLAMVEYYTQAQERFTAEQQPHYIYSPRELTRWKYALNEAWAHIGSLEEMVRLWAHEALRLFEDRLVTAEEKVWCQEKVDELALRFFPAVDSACLARPLMYSAYLTKAYQSCDREELRAYIAQKLHTFSEEEYDVQLVLFDEVLEHIVKIDRVLRQPIGHLLLVGASGVGKTTLSRFVSWANGLRVFQIKAGRNYSLQNFEEDLRTVMKAAGCRMEKTTFIFDESNVLSAAFLERMNALLAAGEVPGLFEGEEYHALISAYKEAQGNRGRESDEDIYQLFTRNVQRNLHVVFTMNPANPDFSNRTASSPAIFNRCVIDWFGDWPEDALTRVAQELTAVVVDEADRPAIADVVVRAHKSVRALNDRLRAADRKANFITPRDYLDFIRQFTSLVTEKRDLLREQEGHLQRGLQSLRTTEATVSQLQLVLDAKGADNERNKQQGEKNLALIMEQKRGCDLIVHASKELEEKIAAQRIAINERKARVEADLAQVEPERLKAEHALRQIKDSQLHEMRNYKVPPEKVQRTLRYVMKFTKDGRDFEWEKIKQEMTRPGFIKEIIEFTADGVRPAVKEEVKREAMTWDIDAVYQSSKAAGPLAKWLQAQIMYADIKETVEPMEREVHHLVQENEAKEAEMRETQRRIAEEEAQIAELTKGYTELLLSSQQLEEEMKTINTQIDKSQRLIASLCAEKDRWEIASREFAGRFRTLVGDCLLAAAFLAYCGFFDQRNRAQLLVVWRRQLEAARIPFEGDLALAEYLSAPAERVTWRAKGLPSDELCTQNAIIIKRCNRYPLVIDPAGQAVDFLANFFDAGQRRLVRTSFADQSFMKQLETALRFGLPVLVEDVERVEPVLNSVLNKEVTRQGGRVVMRVGDQVIDFNAQFRLFMLTREAEARFTPDLCSRVTFVNFSVTPSSLEGQFVGIFLRSERPDIETKQLNLLRLQGEFVAQLRELEERLLGELSASEGANILENEQMVTTLEGLKRQAETISVEKEQSEAVLAEIEQVIAQYRPLAAVAAQLYFALTDLASINAMYQFSLRGHMKAVRRLLEGEEKLAALPRDKHEQRLQVIQEQLFLSVYKSVGNALHERDKLLVALRFAQIKVGALRGPALQTLLTLPARPIAALRSELPAGFLGGLLSKEQLLRLEGLAAQPGFGSLLPAIKQAPDRWVQLIRSREERGSALLGGVLQLSEMGITQTDDHKVAALATEAALLSALKPQAVQLVLMELVEALLGRELFQLWRLDLPRIIEEEAEAKIPVLLASASRTAEQLPWVGTSRRAKTAGTGGSLTTAAATGTAPSAREQRRASGLPSARRICCPWDTSMWCSRCLPRSPTSPSITRASSTTCCSRRRRRR